MVLVEMMKYIPDNYQLILAGNTEGTYSQQIQDRIIELGLENRIMMPGKINTILVHDSFQRVFCEEQ